jgi:hypothetical protein
VLRTTSENIYGEQIFGKKNKSPKALAFIPSQLYVWMSILKGLLDGLDM